MNRDQATLTKLLQRPIAFHRVFVDVTGSVAAGLFLSQLWYWKDRVPELDDDGQPRHGWFYKGVDEWFEETRLTYAEQAQARKILRRLGLLEEKKRGIPARLWFRLNVDRLIELIGSAGVRSSKFDEKSVTRGIKGKFAKKDEKGQQNQQSSVKRKTRVPASGQPDVHAVDDKMSVPRTANTKITSEITPESTHPPLPPTGGGSVGLLEEEDAALRAAGVPPARLGDVAAALARVADPAQRQLVVAEVAAGTAAGKVDEATATALALAKKAAGGRLTAGWSRLSKAEADAAKAAEIEERVVAILAAAEAGHTILLEGEPVQLDGRFLRSGKGNCVPLQEAVARGRVEMAA